MSRNMLALVSFFAGAVSMFLFSLGNQTVTVAHASESQRGIVVEGAVPTVPPLRGILVRNSHFTNVIQPLDGVDCEECDFNNAVLEYGGGAFRLIKPTFEGPIRIHLNGAAGNTFALLQFLQAVEAGRKPKPAAPNQPMLKTANFKLPTSFDLITPFGQK